VFGEFTAALRQPSGSWVIVRPAPEPFPNAWQTRVGLWFLACLAVLGPVGYIFARRLVAPIGAFARAADRLGRDPNAPPLALKGPAEIGIAARAFNTMQMRLQRYVADRTSMIAAISHDLRTPLARVRFKMEQASEGLRASVGSDLDEMEAMITAVLSFVRDANEIRERTDLDLLSVLECAVDDAVAAGGQADLVGGDPVVVEADDLALKRLFANLIDNAVKYGGCAKVCLSVNDGAAVVEVSDGGPGLPLVELERVFEPFYRAERSRNRETGGMGLGLAVARSIARAHGGDVTLANGDPGLRATVRLPLAKLGAAVIPR
jgi:signal transduction histidine kinase